jgi:hypothetical protein
MWPVHIFRFQFDITTCFLHIDRVVNKARVRELFVLYIYFHFFIDWFTTYPCINVCYDSSDFRDTLYDQIGSEHVPVDVNERVSSCFWCDSCCMTKYDQITSGVSHRPITEGTSESSSRNYVILLIFNFLIFVNLKKKLS